MFSPRMLALRARSRVLLVHCLRACNMSSAEHLTREQLVQRVRELEAELGRVASGHAVAAPPATPADAAVHVAKDAKKRSASHTEGGKAKRARKAFDMSRYRQRHIALKVAYVGTNYHGLAVQANAPSVEAELFKALERTRLIEGRDTCNYSRCGRTDKGVSALGQVCRRPTPCCGGARCSAVSLSPNPAGCGAASPIQFERRGTLCGRRSASR